jgi:hypothetical protein
MIVLSLADVSFSTDVSSAGKDQACLTLLSLNRNILSPGKAQNKFDFVLALKTGPLNFTTPNQIVMNIFNFGSVRFSKPNS